MEKTDQDQLQEVYQKLESGDIPVTEALKQSNALTAEMATKQAANLAKQHTQNVFQHRDTIDAQEQWHKDYPDYQEFVESGQAENYMSKNPILIDQTIAYFQYKADQQVEANKSETKTKEPAGADKKFLSQDEIENLQMQTLESMKHRRPSRREALSEDEVLKHQMSTLKKIRGES